MKMQINYLPLGAAFGAVKIAVSPVKLYTKQHCTHKRCFIRHYRRDEIKMRTITTDKHRAKEGFGKMNHWANRLSRWASKVKINAYYKRMKVFFDLACTSTCYWGLQKPKYEPFITHNRGALKNVIKIINDSKDISNVYYVTKHFFPTVLKESS